MNTTLIEDLADLIEIPQDGTLSRVLFADGPIRLVAFAFDTGQELTEHTSARPVIIQVVTGSLEVGIGSETHVMYPRAWLFLPGNAPHSIKAHEPARMLLTMLAR